jgi:hypothetical protein
MLNTTFDELVESFPIRIVAAAIKVGGDPNLYLGRSHSDILLKHRKRIIPYLDRPGLKTGFVTSSGKFVDRKRASRLATSSGQLTLSGVEQLPSEFISGSVLGKFKGKYKIR